MNYAEQAITFGCDGQDLPGVLCRPARHGQWLDAETAVLIVVGGPQYRAGSHRQFVHLARRLSEAGYACLRFDHRGIGDSGGALRSFESLDEDIAAAISALQQALPGCRRIVLWGLCDAASAVLLYCARRADPRVQGLCLLNPWVRSTASLARTHIKHHYRQRLLSREFWVKLLRGGVALDAPVEFLQALLRSRQVAPSSVASYQDLMHKGWTSSGGPILLQLSDEDYTAKEFLEYADASPAWRTAMREPKLQVVRLAGADHTVSQPAARRRSEEALIEWLQQMTSPSRETLAAENA